MSSPFDEAKYNALLKGLEVSEVKFSELENEIRLDAELYDKNYVLFKSAVKRIPYTTFADECSVIKKGIFDINSSCYCDEGIPFVRISNLKEMKIDTTDIVHIPIFEHRRNYKTELKRDDIVLSKTAIPAASIVNLDCCNVSQDTVAIKLKSDSKLLSHYVVVFLNTKYGLEQMKHRFTGNIQMHLNLEECKNEVLIPVFDRPFQEKIKTYFLRSIDLSEKSKSLYAQAEDMLLSELGLKDWQPKNEAVSIKTFSDFASSGRLDAEYYQSKYDEIEERIKSVPHKTLNEIADIQDSNFNPTAKVVYKYIELANIGTSGEITGCTEDLGENLPSRARRVVHTGDVLVSSIEGSLQSCAIVSKDYDGALCSTGFYVLKAIDMNPESLLILLKTQIMQQLLKKGCSGTILTAISKDEFNRVIIPILPQDIQKQIAELIQRSFALRQVSKQLLEEAKKMVEAEIEK